MKLSVCSFILAVLIIAQASFAFSISAPQETMQISTGTTRQIPIIFESTGSDTVIVSLSEAYPWMSITDSVLKVSASEKNSTILIISPPIGSTAGLYRIRIIGESLFTKEKNTLDLFFSITKGEVLDIETIAVTGNLQPSGDVTIAVTVENFRTTTAQDAELTIVTTSPGKRKVFEANQILGRIDPGQKATEEFTFALPPGAEAGAYEIEATLTHGALIRTAKQTFFVASKPAITITEEKFPLLFGYAKTITARNYGNDAGDIVVEEDISGFESVFYSGPEPLSRDPYAWRIDDVQPLGEGSITYRIDFSPIFALVIAVIVVGWVIFFQLRTVRINKYIMQKKMLEEGEEFTVGVDVRNSSGRNMAEIVVRDFVPTMFEVHHAHGPKPIEKKVVGGKELIWKIKDLYSHEERVLTYKIIPIFGVSGAIKLPPARVTYKQGNREVTRTSFSPHIGVSQPVEESVMDRVRRRKK